MDRTALEASRGEHYLNLFRKATFIAGPRFRTKIAVLISLAVIVAVLELIGALLLFGLIALLVGEITTFHIPLVGDLKALLGSPSQNEFLVIATAGVAIFFLIRGGLMLFQTYVQARIIQRIGAGLAVRLLRAYLATDYQFHLQRNSAELIRNVNQSTAQVATSFFLPWSMLVSHGLISLGIVVALLFSSAIATLIAASLITPAALILSRAIQPRMKHHGEVAHDAMRGAQKVLQEVLQGVRDVKVLGKSEFFLSRLNEVKAIQARSNYLLSTFQSVPRVLMEAVLMAFLVVFVTWAVTSGESVEQLIPVLGLVGYASLRLLPSISQIVASHNNMKFYRPALEAIWADLIATEDSRREDRGTSSAFREQITCHRLTFGYEGHPRLIISDLNMSIHKGQFVGIVGETGSGKSTLLDLLMGLLHPISGFITVDGDSIGDDIAGYQRMLGVVPQAPFILDDTLRNNIALGLLESEIHEEKVREAVTTASLEDLVKVLPEGLDSLVGERGTRVSGGQRQRIAIARALYTDPSILFLDEATSAVDNATEERIIGNLQRRKGKLTVVMVAHRLSTLRYCDVIHVIDSGRIVESGSFAELVEGDRLFTRLHNAEEVKPQLPQGIE